MNHYHLLMWSGTPGDTSSGGVHRLFIDGLESNSVGDDREKNRVKSLPLLLGDHAIRWELTGGEIGNSLIAFYESGTLRPLSVSVPSPIQQAAESLPTRKRIANSSDLGMPPRPPELTPPVPPFISTQPMDAAVERGQPAQFPVNMGGTAPITIEGYFRFSMAAEKPAHQRALLPTKTD